MNSPTGAIDLVWCLFPDRASAEQAAIMAVDGGLAACVNILAPASSVYRWEGKVEIADEVPLLCKAAVGTGAALAEQIAKGHPYALPAISWWTAACGSELAAWASPS